MNFKKQTFTIKESNKIQEWYGQVDDNGKFNSLAIVKTIADDKIKSLYLGEVEDNFYNGIGVLVEETPKKVFFGKFFDGDIDYGFEIFDDGDVNYVDYAFGIKYDKDKKTIYVYDDNRLSEEKYKCYEFDCANHKVYALRANHIEDLIKKPDSKVEIDCGELCIFDDMLTVFDLAYFHDSLTPDKLYFDDKNTLCDDGITSGKVQMYIPHKLNPLNAIGFIKMEDNYSIGELKNKKENGLVINAKGMDYCFSKIGAKGLPRIKYHKNDFPSFSIENDSINLKLGGGTGNLVVFEGSYGSDYVMIDTDFNLIIRKQDDGICAYGCKKEYRTDIEDDDSFW